MRTSLGVGILNWPRGERISDRYGCVTLAEDVEGDKYVDLVRLKPGLKGKLEAHVLETRQSWHIGDWARGVFPETPEVGEVILLGEGLLFYDLVDGIVHVGLKPEDERKHDWLNIKKLYRAHEQTVELFFERTEDAGQD